MRNRSISPLILSFLAIAVLGAATASAQGQQAGWGPDPCANVGGDHRSFHCEVRDVAIPAGGAILLDARPNGSITVHGWNKPAAQLRARVVANAETEAEARSAASAVQVVAEGSHVRVEGPRGESGYGWSVSFELMAPVDAAVELQATNGSISIADMAGRIKFETTNGSIRLLNVNGQVEGHTTNGSVKADLDGAGWNGEGLNVHTTNGSIKIAVPQGYAAQLEAETNMGSIRAADLPVEKAEGRFQRRVTGALGAGGAPITLRTTNGSIAVETK